MPRIALLGYALFAALAFGWRSWLQWRRTGSTGFRGLSGERGSLGRLLFVVAILVSPLAAAFDLGGLLPRIAVLDTRIVRLAGCVTFALGLAGTLWSQVAMGDSWRIGVDASERTTLITNGPYRRVRNPIFTFMVLAVLGLALLTPNALALAAVAAVIAAVEIQVRTIEEPYLERVHGEPYRAYRERSGRFVPGVGR